MAMTRKGTTRVMLFMRKPSSELNPMVDATASIGLTIVPAATSNLPERCYYILT